MMSYGARPFWQLPGGPPHRRRRDGPSVRGRQRSDRSRAAVKVLHARLGQDDATAARFLQEARLANRVKHPGIVAVYEFGQLPDGAPFLVMEYLEGEGLRTRLQRQGHLGRAEAMRLGRQLASAVAAAHEQGVVHRDLKPDNVMLVPDPEAPSGERVKILDFGLAKLLLTGEASTGAPHTQEGAVLGTLSYMAPEQCRSDPQITGKANVYALGVMLYEMLAGRRPFVAEAGSAAILWAQHQFQEPPPLEQQAPAVGKELATQVHAMLAKDPRSRPTMLEVAASLAALEGASPADDLTTPLRRLPAVLLSYAGLVFSVFQRVPTLR